jgi:hypothetical protein
MPIRRAFFVWQFVAAAVLPLWVLLGYALWGSGLSGLFGMALLAPLLVIAELGLAVLFTTRASVRRSRALDWPAIGVLALFHAAVIGLGFFGPASAWFGVVAVAAALGGYWLAVYSLVREVRARMRSTLASLGYQPRPEQRPLEAGEYVVIKPSTR